MKVILLILAASGIAPALAADPLDCPAGAQAMRDAGLRQEKRNEWCQDTRTGKPNGPARIVNATETVLVNIEFRQGQAVAQRFTRAGLDRLLSEVNSSYAAQGTPASFTLIDEQTLRFDMELKGGMPGVGIAEFRKQVLAMPSVCRMLAMAETDFRTINIVASSEQKTSLGSTTITRADCEKSVGN